MHAHLYASFSLSYHLFSYVACLDAMWRKKSCASGLPSAFNAGSYVIVCASMCLHAVVVTILQQLVVSICRLSTTWCGFFPPEYVSACMHTHTMKQNSTSRAIGNPYAHSMFPHDARFSPPSYMHLYAHTFANTCVCFCLFMFVCVCLRSLAFHENNKYCCGCLCVYDFMMGDALRVCEGIPPSTYLSIIDYYSGMPWHRRTPWDVEFWIVLDKTMPA